MTADRDDFVVLVGVVSVEGTFLLAARVCGRGGIVTRLDSTERDTDSGGKEKSRARHFALSENCPRRVEKLDAERNEPNRNVWRVDQTNSTRNGYTM